MKRSLTILVLSAAMATFASVAGGMGSGGGMMAGSGMLVVADDGSLLITNMDMGSMMGGGVGIDHRPRARQHRV